MKKRNLPEYVSNNYGSLRTALFLATSLCLADSIYSFNQYSDDMIRFTRGEIQEEPMRENYGLLGILNTVLN